LEGDIREANTFYQDEHTLVGKCDCVMANPPFNVDKVDAEKVKDDPRLPFGLPGVNKEKRVSNGNYLWISYFWSYLNDRGRAGFVMSSQASSAGHGERDVRRKIIETGDVDVMIAIRGNFFYTRTVPCELWFFDRSKPRHLRDKVLMLDARGVYRKVSRKLNDFAPEQLANLSAIIWLYRGHKNRFLELVKEYLGKVCQECAAIPAAVAAFDKVADTITTTLTAFAKAVKGIKGIGDGSRQPLSDALAELAETTNAYAGDRDSLLKGLVAFRKTTCKTLPSTNKAQHSARAAFDPIADGIKGLIKQIDLIYKLTARSADAAATLAADKVAGEHLDRRELSRQVKSLDAIRHGWDDVVAGQPVHRPGAVEQLKAAAYFHRQIVWLQDRFPEAELRDVPGLVKLVDRAEIEAADWSLTPGRYVGVAPAEIDEDFDFEEALREIHVELSSLNKEAVVLSKKIAENFEELGV
jgi:type I restriction enzyme M protein